MKTKARILVAGIGNIFLGDDAFGSEVARRLQQSCRPAQVRIEDFGIRGFDLAFALLEGYELTIMIDAAPRGGTPGTLYQIAPDFEALDELNETEMTIETHGMNPMKVLTMVKSMGGVCKRTILIGCEPAALASEDGQMGLSPAVEAAIPEAIRMVKELITEVLPNFEKFSAAA
ncbi:MAG: hydrogenase maturation protease [Proteobacteria bacterium]|nr:MAG: hydrogenase maturation protease [Pseudomonadota bacterium]